MDRNILSGSFFALLGKAALMPLAIVNKVLLARCLGPGLFGAYVIFLRICDLAGIFSLLGTKTLTVKLIGIAAGEKDWGLLKGTLSCIFKIVLVSSAGTVLLIWLIRQPLCLKIFKSPDLLKMLVFFARPAAVNLSNPAGFSMAKFCRCDTACAVGLNRRFVFRSFGRIAYLCEKV